MIKFISDLVDVSGIETLFYVNFENDSLDFTNSDTKFVLNIYSAIAGCSVSIDKKDLPLIVEVLKSVIFLKDNKVIVWNWKEVVSYISFHLGKLIEFKGVILDLKLIESYFYVNLEKPNSFETSLDRFRTIKKDLDWDVFYNIYKSVYWPLSSLVIPSIENTPLLDYDLKDRVYSHYSINGQDNGRMLCSNDRTKGYNPHILSLRL